MTVRSVGFIALHSCPLRVLGEGKAGGMSVYIRGLGRELARRNISVTVITTRHSEPDDNNPHGDRLRVAHLPSPPVESASGWAAGASRFAEEITAVLDPDCDVIHSHYWASGLAASEVSRRLSIPHVATFHTMAAVKEHALIEAASLPAAPTTQNQIEAEIILFDGALTEPHERHLAEQEIARGADGIVAWTPFEAGALVSLLGAERERITVAPIGVDSQTFRAVNRADARARLGISASAEILLYVGRLDRIKGADVLLRAAALLADSPQLRVRFVGGAVDEGYSAGLRTLAAELGITNRISWVGTVPHDELVWEYAAADMLVVPSYSESFSIAAAEAMACGTPVVASDVPGPASFIRDGASGRLVPPGDPSALACAIKELLDDKELRSGMGSAALVTARSLTWQASADAVLGLYEHVTDLRRTASGH